MPKSALPKPRFSAGGAPATRQGSLQPASGLQVETERIDPADVLAPRPAPQSFSGDVMQHAEPINTKVLPGAPLSPEELAAAAPVLATEPPVSAIDLLVTDDLIARLEKELGFSNELHDLDLKVGTTTVKVSVRKPEYDDYLWTMAVVERKVSTGEDQAILMTDGQREQVMGHMIAARCVVKIHGKNVWDVFKASDEVAEVVPSWAANQGYGRLPDFMKAKFALSVFELFRRLHPDLLFALGRELAKLEKTEPEAPPENPTDGA